MAKVTLGSGKAVGNTIPCHKSRMSYTTCKYMPLSNAIAKPVSMHALMDIFSCILHCDNRRVMWHIKNCTFDYVASGPLG